MQADGARLGIPAPRKTNVNAVAEPTGDVERINFSNSWRGIPPIIIMGMTNQPFDPAELAGPAGPRWHTMLWISLPVAAVQMFKLSADGMEATRVSVGLGRVSKDGAEVVDGLQPGDRVIVSDMSTWNRYDRVRLQ
jgi:hypothetical protein